MRDWLLSGIRDGFYILNTNHANNDINGHVIVENYKSATGDNKMRCEAQIIEELQNGRYHIARAQPKIVSALGAIDKGNGKVRLIHDASRPSGSAINDFCTPEKFQYENLQSAVDLITPSCYMAKADISQAFRHVKIHPSNYPFTGLRWRFEGDEQDTFMYDSRLCFGSSRAPFIFNELSQAVKRFMHARGFAGHIVAYLDDYLIIHPDKNTCQHILNALLALLRKLGFGINYSKVLPPTQRIEFLGIILDSMEMITELPATKITALRAHLENVNVKTKTTRRDLQSLAGKLSYATQCIYGGSFFVRRLHDAIRPLKHPWHRTRITASIRKDIAWWLQFLEIFNGKMPMVENRQLTPIFTDACLEAAGGVFGDRFVYHPWNLWPETESLPINYKETLAIEIALNTWAKYFVNQKIIIHCDNMAAVAIVNKGSCRNPIVMSSLRRIYWLSAIHNFRFRAVYLEGSKNSYADAVSRLHERKQTRWSALGVKPIFDVPSDSRC